MVSKQVMSESMDTLERELDALIAYAKRKRMARAVITDMVDFKIKILPILRGSNNGPL